LSSLKQNCAAKADLEKLKRDCATKSEFDSLKQISATKADLDQLKRDCATKSEIASLKQNSITKDELTRRCDQIVGECTGTLVSFQSGSPLNGIIRYLTKSAGGNLCDRGIVNATSSSLKPDRPDRVASNVVDLDTEDDFCSDNFPGQWICLEFKSHRVQISDYSIRSFRLGQFFAHPKSWVLEGSSDNQNWIELDRRFNNDQLNGALLSATFHVTTSAFYRFIRLRQTDVNHHGTHWLVFSAFELFGRVSTY
jgi:hypothetical protein